MHNDILLEPRGLTLFFSSVWSYSLECPKGLVGFKTGMQGCQRAPSAHARYQNPDLESGGKTPHEPRLGPGSEILTLLRERADASLEDHAGTKSRGPNRDPEIVGLFFEGLPNEGALVLSEGPFRLPIWD